MKKLRIFWLILLIIVAALLSACANADISYQLTNDNAVDIRYTLTLPGEKAAADYADTICAYWQSMGFEASCTQSGETNTLNGRKSTGYDTKEQAVQAFSALLTDKDSLFYNVSFIYTPSFEEDFYSLSALISLKDVIRQNEAQNIPSAEIDKLENSANEGTYTLSIALPGEVVSSNADDQQGQVCSWSLKYGEITQIAIQTKSTNTENIAYYAQLSGDYVRDSLWFTVCCIAAGAAVLAVIICALLRRRARH